MDTTTDHNGPSDTDEAATTPAADEAESSPTPEVAVVQHDTTEDADADTDADIVSDSDTVTDADEESPVGDEHGASGSSDDEARPSRRSRAAADLVREGEVAADFLETLMDIADLDGDLEVDVDGDRAAVSIVDSEEGSVPRRLVGNKAAVLEALQELTRLAVQAETGDRSRLMLDIGGHRAQRRDSLVHSAAGVIASVKADGEKQEMEPMTAFERKVVHDEVLKAGLRSQSEGEEPRRFVVVLPASS